MEWVQQLSHFIELHANAWWTLPLVTLLAIMDGFFPPLPSESVMITLAVYSAAGHGPNPWLIFAFALLGAVIGDNISYAIGRHSGLHKLRHANRPRIKRAFDFAERELGKRGGMLIFVGRYIPVGRLAVNVTAGATRFPYKRFVVFDTLACITWAAYSVLVGFAFGKWLKEYPLLGSLLGIGFAVTFGYLLDRAIQKWVAKDAPEAPDAD